MQENSTLQGVLVDAWSARGVLACALWPLSWIYRALIALRRHLYRWGWLATRRVDAMVIVVGNVVAGGVGKTPTVTAVVKHLQQENYQVGIVSRGYGRASTTCLEVGVDSTADEVGDEPLMLRQATEVPVFVDRNRHAAAQALLNRYPHTQIIVCDDGLQHYGLSRDLEICVFDDRGCGNGWLLPAGPLREPWPRQALPQVGQADERLLALHTGSRPAFAGYRAQRTLGSVAIHSDGSTVPIETLHSPSTSPLLALAGIGQPEIFFSMLRALKIPLARTLPLPDHYNFNSMSRSVYEGYRIICTEKDALKLWRIAPDALAIPLLFQVDAEFFNALDAQVTSHFAAKLSSTHGHTIT